VLNASPFQNAAEDGTPRELLLLSSLLACPQEIFEECLFLLRHQLPGKLARQSHPLSERTLHTPCSQLCWKRSPGFISKVKLLKKHKSCQRNRVQTRNLHMFKAFNALSSNAACEQNLATPSNLPEVVQAFLRAQNLPVPSTTHCRACSSSQVTTTAWLSLGRHKPSFASLPAAWKYSADRRLKLCMQGAH